MENHLLSQIPIFPPGWVSRNVGIQRKAIRKLIVDSPALTVSVQSQSSLMGDGTVLIPIFPPGWVSRDVGIRRKAIRKPIVESPVLTISVRNQSSLKGDGAVLVILNPHLTDLHVFVEICDFLLNIATFHAQICWVSRDVGIHRKAIRKLIVDSPVLTISVRSQSSLKGDGTVLVILNHHLTDLREFVENVISD
ncbi:hypothetical protein CDAR_547971 [Caerostris darwini]|uniref:Uncharacterized protein n=1 Tax=Caerostris darwini TaxID=1538125 RepID=A0AAV4WG27_9ARAC|nr:hypothetical protein CDAR_547971 [Caerostris darwini]